MHTRRVLEDLFALQHCSPPDIFLDDLGHTSSRMCIEIEGTYMEVLISLTPYSVEIHSGLPINPWTNMDCEIEMETLKKRANYFDLFRIVRMGGGYCELQGQFYQSVSLSDSLLSVTSGLLNECLKESLLLFREIEKSFEGECINDSGSN